MVLDERPSLNDPPEVSKPPAIDLPFWDKNVTLCCLCTGRPEKIQEIGIRTDRPTFVAEPFDFVVQFLKQSRTDMAWRDFESLPNAA
jgi:hypothetical protein